MKLKILNRDVKLSGEGGPCECIISYPDVAGQAPARKTPVVRYVVASNLTVREAGLV